MGVSNKQRVIIGYPIFKTSILVDKKAGNYQSSPVMAIWADYKIRNVFGKEI